MIIRKLRKERGWTQEQLAEFSGVSVRTIQRIERGGRASLETLKCLAAVFERDIPELTEDMEMGDGKRTRPNIEGTGETSGEWVRLDAEDRAALRFARQLRRYDEYGDDDDATEVAVRRQVRRERKFWTHFAVYIAVMLLLLAVNLVSNPDRLWVVWPALGWGLGVALHALSVFTRTQPLGRGWERREVERRLADLAKKH